MAGPWFEPGFKYRMKPHEALKGQKPWDIHTNTGKSDWRQAPNGQWIYRGPEHPIWSKPQPKPKPTPKPNPKPPGPAGPVFYVIKVPKFTGKEKTTKFTEQSSQFVMKGGMFGYPKDAPSNRYAYNTKYLNNGKSFLWYIPPGLDGLHETTWHYRATSNRSTRRPDIRLKRPGFGTVKVLIGPYQYQKESAYKSFDFIFDLKPGDYIEIMPDGSGSISFGKMEFKRVGGTKPTPKPQPTPKPAPTPTGKRIVQEVGGHGIMCMSLLSNGQVLFGEYRLKTSRLWCLGIKASIATIKTGESIFRICEDRGRVYLALEDYKIAWGILRDNPRLLKFPNVKKLLPGPYDGAWDIKRVNNKLILLGGGEIVVSGKRVRKWEKQYYVKKIVHYIGSPLIIGWNATHENAGWLSGKSWKWQDKTPRGSQARFMSGATDLSRKKMWLVGTANYKGSGHHRNSATIWTYTAGKLNKIKTFQGYDYSSCVEFGPNGKVYFLLTRRWKKHIPGAKLMEMSGSTTRVVATFDESEGRAIVFKGGNILIATRSHGKRGRVYEIGGVL